MGCFAPRYLLLVFLAVGGAAHRWVPPCAGQTEPLPPPVSGVVPDGPAPADMRPASGPPAAALETVPAMPLASRAEQFLQAAGDDGVPPGQPQLPPHFRPWWEEQLGQVQRPGVAANIVNLDALVIQALQYAPEVQAIRDTYLIRSTALLEARAEFDPRTFMESKFARTSDPVGNKLTTGGPPRFNESNWYYTGGLRKRTTTGARIEMSQRTGYLDNNSLFLDPTEQGNARLSLSFTQPLLNGAGRPYNTSHIVLAELDAGVAQDEVVSGIQRHLVNVTRAYWDLYLRRAVLRQKDRHYRRAQEILKRLEDRRSVDALQSQILAARAAVAVRYGDLNRAASAIRNAEVRIRALVAAPSLFGAGAQEYIPVTLPQTNFVPIVMGDAFATALYHRPEIDVAMRQTRMASVRLAMSEKELLPILDMVLETYVAGLQGDSELGQAWLDQFTVGQPSYTAGLVFEVPLHNRAARARYERRQVELRQVTSQLRAMVDATLAEVEIGVRDVHTTFRDVAINYQTMIASQAEMDYLLDRWQSLPGDDRAASFLLDDLLKSQDRLAAAEYAFVEAQVNYHMALILLKQAMGVLIVAENPDDALPAVPAEAVEPLPPTDSPSTPNVAPRAALHRLPPIR